jgi:hypothetical protein
VFANIVVNRWKYLIADRQTFGSSAPEIARRNPDFRHIDEPDPTARFRDGGIDRFEIDHDAGASRDRKFGERRNPIGMPPGR